MIRILISMTIVFLYLTTFISCGSSGGGSGGSNDSDINTSQTCPDSDGDGYADASCDGSDCDDRNPDINPLARDICGDDIDQNCDGSDKICGDGGASGAATATNGRRVKTAKNKITYRRKTCVNRLDGIGILTVLFLSTRKSE